MKRSFIISYKENGEDRRNNLKRLLNYLSWLLDGETEIIIVEQDSESKIDWLSEIKRFEQITHIFVQNTGIFNKGWGYNIGAKVAKGDFLIFNDSDMFLRLDSYRSSISLLNRFDVVNPYKSIYYLNEENTNVFVSNNYNFNVIRDIKPTLVHVISGGIFMIKKEVFLSLKGFDEDCYGYGHEDDIFDTKIKKLGLSLNTINDIAIHIYHQGSTINDDYYSFENINKLLFMEYADMNVEDLKLKIESVDFFGELNKEMGVLPIKHIKLELYKRATDAILSSILKKIDDEFIDELIKDTSEKAYNLFIDSFTEKLKKEFDSVVFTEKDKKTLVEKIIRKIKL